MKRLNQLQLQGDANRMLISEDSKSTAEITQSVIAFNRSLKTLLTDKFDALKLKSTVSKLNYQCVVKKNLLTIHTDLKDVKRVIIVDLVSSKIFMDDKEVRSDKQQQFVMAVITEIMKQMSHPEVSMELIRDYKEEG